MTAPIELLVPIQVEALVVNENDRRATTWSVSARTYAGADRVLPIEPPPFARDNDRPRTGVTVHWLLPDALTVGQWHGGDGEGGMTGLRAPHVPDRWLVVRTTRHPDEPTRPVEPRAWVVESNHVGPEGTNPFPVAGGVDYLGRATELSRWPREAGAAPAHVVAMTALGPETAGTTRMHDLDPAYAASVANIDNVFALHDPLDDLATEDDPAAVLSYAVIGWYSDPDGSDPMRNPARLGRDVADLGGAGSGSTLPAEDWRRVMDALDWTTGEDDALEQALAQGLVPSSTVLHGMVYGVRWTGFRGPAQPFTRGADSAFARTAIRSRAGWRNPEPGDATGFGDIAGADGGPRLGDAAGLRRPGGAADVEPGTRSLFPHLAIGSSSTDALAAVLGFLLAQEDHLDDDADHLATLFEALEHDLLDVYERAGGVAELDRRLHQDGFTSHPGGVVFDVVLRAPEDGSAADSDRLMPEGPDLLRAIGLEQDLDELNDCQRRLEEAEAALWAARRELYAVWWKSRRHRDVANPASGADPSSQQIIDRLAELQGWLAVPQGEDGTPPQQYEDALPAGEARNARDAKRCAVAEKLASDAVGASLAEIPGAAAATPTLHETPRARFFAPADPVVVVSGVRASSKHGGDGQYRDDGRLFVRAASGSEAAGGPTLQLRLGETRLGPDQVVGAFFGAMLEGKPLPAATGSILTELVLLDDGWRNWLAAQTAAAVDPLELVDLQRRLWPSPDTEEPGPTPTIDAAFDGVRPSPVAVEEWSRPWRPVYLAWRTTWYPSHAATPEGELVTWEFDGEELAWNGLSDFDHSRAQTIQGRCLLSGTATRALRDATDAIYERLENAAVDPQETAAAEMERKNSLAATRAALDRVKQRLASADLLAQSMTGFHEQLVQRDPAQFHEADEPTRALLGNVERAAPMPYGDDSAGPRFHPLRGGHIRLRRAWVVDAFGQVFDVIHEQGQTDASFVPLRGRGFTTVGLTQRADTQMLQLAPRLVQPSRLVFRFRTDSGTDSGTGAVAGWLQPNHFDGSLMVSDPGGTLVGALLLWRADGQVRWEAAPGQAGALPDGASTLRRVVNRLQGLDFAGFEQVLGAVDKTLATTDPAGRRGETASVLVGRPLAVVEAELYLELDGPAFPDQAWRHTLTDPADASRVGGVGDLRFRVRLGLPDSRDDGIVGFYVEGDERDKKFHSVLPGGGASDHIDWSAPGTWPSVPVRVRGEDHPDALRVTLLVDPRGSLTASSGVQPSKTLRLPRHLVAGPMSNLDASFRVGPILSTGTAVRMPLPADIARGWSWIERTGVRLTPEGREETWSTPVDVEPVPPGSPLADAPTHLREGWLQLSQVVAPAEEEET